MALSDKELYSELVKLGTMPAIAGRIVAKRGKPMPTDAELDALAKITPEDFCTALYQAYVRDGVDNFFPNQLQGNKALEVAKRFTANYESVSPKQLWTTQIALLKKAIDRTKRPVEDILLDHALPFSAWFRIVATVDPVQAITDRYKNEAKRELTEELLVFLSGVAAQNVSRLRAL